MERRGDGWLSASGSSQVVNGMKAHVVIAAAPWQLIHGIRLPCRSRPTPEFGLTGNARPLAVDGDFPGRPSPLERRLVDVRGSDRLPRADHWRAACRSLDRPPRSAPVLYGHVSTLFRALHGNAAYPRGHIRPGARTPWAWLATSHSRPRRIPGITGVIMVIRCAKTAILAARHADNGHRVREGAGITAGPS
jgi:hypothetical protein